MSIALSDYRQLRTRWTGALSEEEMIEKLAATGSTAPSQYRHNLGG
jgi:hypothetical protein